MTYLPMKDLPRNARFYGVSSKRIEYVITCPASEHPWGWVDVIRESGSGPGSLTFFSAEQAEREVEVIEP